MCGYLARISAARELSDSFITPYIYFACGGGRRLRGVKPAAPVIGAVDPDDRRRNVRS
jgi:hypothetical protein